MCKRSKLSDCGKRATATNAGERNNWGEKKIQLAKRREACEIGLMKLTVIEEN